MYFCVAAFSLAGYPYKPNSPASDIDVSEESVEPRSTS